MFSLWWSTLRDSPSFSTILYYNYRYVVELLKLKETFIDPLLHPFSSVPVSSPALVDPMPDYNSNTAYFRSETPLTHRSQATTQPRQSLENLPIASRFLSTPTEDPPSSYKTQTPARKRSIMSSRQPGASTPVIPDDEEDVNSYEGSEDDDDDAMGRGYAAGTNRVPVRRSPYNSGGGSGRANILLDQLARSFGCSESLKDMRYWIRRF